MLREIDCIMIRVEDVEPATSHDPDVCLAWILSGAETARSVSCFKRSMMKLCHTAAEYSLISSTSGSIFLSASKSAIAPKKSALPPT